MKRFAKLMLSTGVVLLALAAGVARADDPAKKPVIAAESSKVSSTALTDEGLKELLERMGYEFEVIKSTSGTPMYKVKLEQGGWTFTLYVSLSGDKLMLWVAAPLQELPAGDKVPEAILEKILQKTDELGPTQFSLKGRRLYLNRPVENHNITPARLRQALDGTATDVKDTVTYWSPDKWQEVISKDAGKADAGKPDAAKKN
jgi:hypothetical protein